MSERISQRDMPAANTPWRQLTYAAITQRCAEQIAHLVASARRQTGVEAQFRREQAYGLYLGWRALVFDIADPAQFAVDDKRLEAVFRPAKSPVALRAT